MTAGLKACTTSGIGRPEGLHYTSRRATPVVVQHQSSCNTSRRATPVVVQTFRSANSYVRKRKTLFEVWSRIRVRRPLRVLVSRRQARRGDARGDEGTLHRLPLP